MPISNLLKLNFLTFIYIFYYIFLSEKGKGEMLCHVAYYALIVGFGVFLG